MTNLTYTFATMMSFRCIFSKTLPSTFSKRQTYSVPLLFYNYKPDSHCLGNQYFKTCLKTFNTWIT